MNRFLILILILFITSGCREDEKSGQQIADYDCLIINQGNFSEANGELSLLTSEGEIINQAYQKSNQWALASIIESAIPYKNNWILFCANEDKIEIITQDDLKLKISIKGVPIPRYGVTIEDTLYVTSVKDWKDQNSGKVYKIDLKKGEIINEIKLGGLPEGILQENQQLWVATKDTIYVINSKTHSIQHRICTENKNLTAKHLIAANNKIWCSLSTHEKSGELLEINPENLEIENRYELPYLTYEGHLELSPDKESIYYLSCQSIIGGQNADSETKICKWNIFEKTHQTVVKGVGFYGFNVHPVTEEIYTANINGFITNSLIFKYDKLGNRTNDGLLGGVGACRFLFRSTH